MSSGPSLRGGTGPTCPRESREAGSRVQRVDLLREARLAVGGVVLVQNALRHGLVQLARGDLECGPGGSGVASGDLLAQRADRGPHLTADLAVAVARLLVREIALDLRLDVCQRRYSFVR